MTVIAAPKKMIELVSPSGQSLTPTVVEPERTVTRSEAINIVAELARNGTDVGTIEKMVGLLERVEARDAKAAFNAAHAQMFARLPSIDRDGKIVIPGKHTIPFSTYKALNDVCRPIMLEFGFSMRHRHRMEGGLVYTVGVLTHSQGHFEEDEFASAPDTSGSKNNIQAVGSTRQYGRRYTMISLLNLVTYEKGHDGETPGEAEPEQQRQEQHPVPGKTQAPIASHANEHKTINEGQQKRFHAIVTQHRGTKQRETVKAWLLKEWGYRSTKDITVKDYDAICSAVENPGPLPARRRQ